jgi:tetratricopeptide (TPR) repeat protein
MMKENLAPVLKDNIALLALLLVTFLIYMPSLNGGFVVDDTPIIKDNPYLKGNHLLDFFGKGFWANTALGDNTIAMYRPLVLVIFSMGHKLWGSDPAGYHIFQLLLHLTNTILVYIFIRKLSAALPVAAMFGASIFALHPSRVESVAWLSGVTDPIAVFFLLGAMLAYRSSSENPYKWRYVTLSLVCFQMALWSKEVAIVFPLIIAMHDVIFRKRINWIAVLLHTLLVAAYLITRSFALGTTGKWDAINLSQLSKPLDFILGYSQLLVFPTQVPFYIQPPAHSVSSALGWFSLTAIALLAGFAFRAFNKEKMKPYLFSVMWVIAFAWPAVLMMFYLDGYYSARFLYVPATGIALFAALLYSHINEKYPALAIPVGSASALLISFYGIITWQEIPYWHDDGAAYSRITKISPESGDGFIGLANYYMKQEDYPAAERYFLTALQKVKAPLLRTNTLVALGTIYGITGQVEKSGRFLQEAVQIDPGNSEALTGLGNLALMQGRYSDSIAYYQKAIDARFGNYEATMNMALAYEKIGQPERAESLRRTIH